MGKLSDVTTGGSKSASPDGVSLHTNPGESYRDSYRDDEDAPQLQGDDLPPSYGAAILGPSDDPPPAPSLVEIPYFMEDANSKVRYYVDRRLEDPVRLEQLIRAEAATPPRPYMRLLGTHTETTRDSKGKTERNTVTDFDVSVELTPYLYSDAQYRRSWTRLRTVENGERAKRGTVFAGRAPGSGSGAARDIEVGGADAKPTLREWCHRYAASHAGLKCFALRRRMVGFDAAGVVYRLRRLVNDTNYRGNLRVELVVRNEVVECYNECRTNRWRFTVWIWWLVVLSLIFVLTWPYLWLRTKRWEVVVAEWPFSVVADDGSKQYVSISEDQWYNLWARAICKAVLEKRQTVLDQADLRRAEEPEPPLSTGHAGVDGAAGLLRAGINAMNEVNRHLGWGGDC
ncbi:hypothetical protein DL766_009209 [Monosporascus sp. MC13-8B]|uniref:Uncharacterized protein n=1 Tax=Monosporascus cannonballus TaxID=155416 RepID=A0ABY0GVA3_9PEZI|nr:hypothetical protein DL762_008736 [Monosporascus cannonballus]RYO96993.1 hypothetical protein DL763_002930 [Monosporascus cannonballus]RYP16129.1 hypothetical protein DL766_009209 [Monosporascus sp. MC13-8B]